MPKVLLYITAKITWIFLFFGTYVNENRAHVHVGKKGQDDYCKIWLEPKVEIAKQGELTTLQINQVIKIVECYKKELLSQWKKFKKGEKLRVITKNK